MTPETPPATTATTGPTTWEALEEKARRANGNPFFPIGDVPAGETVRFTVAGIQMDPALFQGKFSVFEMDIDQRGSLYRLCVSGTRLAGAIAALKPKLGDLLELQAIGAPGRERKWLAERVVLAMPVAQPAGASLNGFAAR